MTETHDELLKKFAAVIGNSPDEVATPNGASDATTKLFRAVEDNDLKNAAEALAQGADPSQPVAGMRASFNKRVMPAICACRSLAMLELLVSAGGDLSLTDDEDDPLGHRLLKRPQLRNKDELAPMFKAMLAAGYNIHAATNDMGQQAIHWLTSSQADLLPLLLDAGVDVNVTDKYGATILHNVAYLCETDLAIHLIQHGADPTLKEGNGFAVFDYARAESGREPEEVEAFCLAADAAWQAELMSQRTAEPFEVEASVCPRCGRLGPHRCRF